MVPVLHVQLLGDFCLEYGGETVPGIEGQRLQSLLAYLLLHCDVPRSRAHLAFRFWPDSTEAQARTNLRKQIYHLRRALPQADEFLFADAKVVQCRTDAPLDLDVARFEDALTRADQAEQAGDLITLRASLEEAVSLYGGDLLPDSYDDWVLDERERLRQRFGHTLERLIELLEEQRDYPAAIKHVQRLLRHDTLHEAAYRRLMRLYALNDDRARALRTYHVCVTILQRELEVEPSRATREAYERLLDLEVKPQPETGTLAPVVPLVGRSREWAKLQASWRRALRGQPHLVLLQGEAGIGKTRLAEDLLEWAGRQGTATASARCYASDGELAYAPVATWLRSENLQRTLASLDEMWLSELARLLPDLLVQRPGLSFPETLAEGWQRQRFYAALARPFHGRHPLLLLLDDLQWCDQETLDWLLYLLQDHGPIAAFENRPPQLLLLATVRIEDVAGRGRLALLLRDLRRDGLLTEIELEPLDETETLTLASAVAGREIDPALAAPLYRGSEGNPLFVVEMVRAAGATNGPWDTTHGQEAVQTALSLPPRVRRVIQSRLAGLSPEAQDLLGVAAAIGREFTFDVLARAHGADDETLVRALDELWQRRIVREQGADAYDFGHDRIREVAYDELSSARRRLLHRRVAEALEGLHAADLDAVCGQVAIHYDRSNEPDLAIPYYRQAAGAAQRIFANDDALRYLQRALELLPQAGSTGQEAARAHEQLGAVLALTGDHEGASRAFEAAIAHATEADSLWQAHLRCHLANTWRSQHRYEEARATYGAALQQLGPAPIDNEIAWWQAWLDIQLARADMLYFSSSLSEMAQLCREIGTIVETYGSIQQQANYYSSLIMLENRQNRFRPSAQTLERVVKSLELAEQTGDSQLVDHKRFSLGFSLLWHGDLVAAERELSAALEQAVRTGNVPLQDRSLAYLTVTHRLAGDVPRVQQTLEKAQAVAAAEQNSFYLGVSSANSAWLRIRAADLAGAAHLALEALDHWAPLAFPLEWLARWPLLAINLSGGQISEAVEQAQAMLQPAQQRPPELLEATLVEAVLAWEAGQPDAAHELLAGASTLARQIGYL